MARPRTGTLRRQTTARGLSYGVQFRYRGATHYVHLGRSWDGWDAARADADCRFLIEKVNRGEWSPARVDPATVPPADVPTFQLFASEWLYGTRQTLPDPDGKTARDLEWRLSVLMDKLGPVAVDRIDEALAEDLVADLRAERLAIEHAREQRQPLVESYVDARTGRTHRRRRRGLSNSPINKALGSAERVLRGAKRRHLIDDVRDLRSAGLRPERPRRAASLSGRPRLRRAGWRTGRVSVDLRSVTTYQADGWTALGDPTRRAIFERVADRPRAVGELAAEVPVSRPAVSQHLKVLKDAGLVTSSRDGNRRIYRADPRGVAAMRDQLDRFWNQALATFKEVVEQDQQEVS